MTICWDDDQNLISDVLQACSLTELKQATGDVFLDQIGCCAVSTTALTVDPTADPVQANIDAGWVVADCNTNECPVSFMIDCTDPANAVVYFSCDCGTNWNSISPPSASVPVLTQTFDFTGADQVITVPDGYTRMEMYVWGATGGRRASGTRYSGAGGFASGIQTVTTGEQFVVMVGERGYNTQNTNDGIASYGFGGINTGGAQNAASGGGLSGVFTGAGAVLATDSARALVIGGGGGGTNTSSGNSPGGNGGNGGSPSSGGQPDFDGEASVSSDGAGGGGFTGGQQGDDGIGDAARGGANFALGTLIDPVTDFSPDFTLGRKYNAPSVYLPGAVNHHYAGNETSYGVNAGEGLNGHVVIVFQA
jgi:hypothetical protein